MKYILFFLLLIPFTSRSQQESEAEKIKRQDKIIETYLKNGAQKFSYTSRQWQEWIDKGLAEDSTIAYLWQQKAMPYWKLRKYEIANKYFSNAVKYDRKRYLSRGIFLKCIFSKSYPEVIEDYKKYIAEFKDTRHENDHSLEFYVALAHLGLNEYQAALSILKLQVDHIEKENGKDFVHFLDRFYLGIIYRELNEYRLAIEQFDICLAKYSNFSDAKYWKGLCLINMGEKEKGYQLMKEGKLDKQRGYTINEDASLYELFPYQITWEWAGVE